MLVLLNQNDSIVVRALKCNLKVVTVHPKRNQWRDRIQKIDYEDIQKILMNQVQLNTNEFEYWSFKRTDSFFLLLLLIIKFLIHQHHVEYLCFRLSRLTVNAVFFETIESETITFLQQTLHACSKRKKDERRVLFWRSLTATTNIDALLATLDSHVMLNWATFNFF